MVFVVQLDGFVVVLHGFLIIGHFVVDKPTAEIDQIRILVYLQCIGIHIDSFLILPILPIFFSTFQQPFKLIGLLLSLLLNPFSDISQKLLHIPQPILNLNLHILPILQQFLPTRRLQQPA